jgi:hypothetical protein
MAMLRSVLWTCVAKALLLALLLVGAQIFEPTTRRTTYYIPKKSRSMTDQYKNKVCKWMKTRFKQRCYEFQLCAIKWLRTRPKARQKWIKFNAKGKNCKAKRIVNLMRLGCIMHSTATTKSSSRIKKVNFDTDSSLLRIDNCATRSISPDTKDFVNELTPLLNTRVQGVGGKVTGIMMGTIRWNIEDDQGVVHTITLPNSLYVPSAASRLLSPQHWAQVANDNKPLKRGTWCATYEDQIILYWGQREFRRTIPLDPESSNVASIRTAPGYSRFNAFAAEVGDFEEAEDQLVYDAQVISDDEGPEDIEEQSGEGEHEEDATLQRERPLVTNFDLDGPPSTHRPAV